MITQAKPGFAMTTGDIFLILFTHKKKLLASIVLVMAVTVAAIVFWPRTYASDAKLFVQVGRESVSLDPTATTGQVMPISVSRETEVNSVLEMLRSRVMIEKLVDEIGPGTILRSATPESSSVPQKPSMLTKLATVIELDPVSDREKAVSRVEKQLDVAVEKKSDVITVSGTAKSPELAQLIVAKFIDIYLGAHVQMHRTAGSQAFFTEQTALLQKQLNEALAKLCAAKNELGIVSIEAQRQLIKEETVEIGNKLALSRAALAGSRDKVQALRQKVTGLPHRLVRDETQGFPNAAADNMRQDLYQLEIREAELATRFGDTFPALAAVRAQIAAAKKPLGKEERKRTQQTTTVNLVHDQLQINLLNEEANVDSLNAETRSLAQQLAQMNDRVRFLNEHESQISKLEQEVALCKANYTTYSEKSEQSRIDAALQNERITNVNVIQPANLMAKPVSPKKSVLAAAGALGGIALGVGVALFAEFFGSAVKSPINTDERLPSPVLGSMPRVTPRRTVLK
jgi:polysaccharide biosynthesis protein PslE